MDGATMLQNTQFALPNQTQVRDEVRGNMSTAPHLFPGEQQLNYRTPAPPNGHYQFPPPHVEGNGWPVHQDTNPPQHTFANQTDNMARTECHNGNIMMPPLPHPAGSHHAHMHMQPHHHFRNNNANVQPFQPVNPGLGVQQPVPNGNGHVSNMNNGNSVGNGSGFNRHMSGNHPNEAINAPRQNDQNNQMTAHQNGVAHSPPGVNHGVPAQMQGTHHSEFFRVSNHTGQNNNMVAHQNGVAQPHEVDPGVSPQSQGSHQRTPSHGSNHSGQNNNAAAHHQMNPSAPPYIPGAHHNEPFHEPNHSGQGNIAAPQNRATQPFTEMNPAHPPPYSSQPNPSVPYNAVRDGLNIPPYSEFNGARQTNVGHPNPNSGAENIGIENHHPGSWDPHRHMDQNPPAPAHGSGLPQSQAQPIYPGGMVMAPHLERNDMRQNNPHPNQGVPQASLGGNQTGTVTTHSNGPPQPHQHDAPVPGPTFGNLSTPGNQPDVHALPHNSHSQTSVIQTPDRVSDRGTVPHLNPSTTPPSSTEMGVGVQAPNAMGQSTPPNANPPFPQNVQVHHPFNGGTQPANDQNVENMGNPALFNSGSQGFQNGMAGHPVPAPQPINLSGDRNMNQNNHGSQNNMVHHQVPVPQPSDLNAAHQMNQNNHGSQNGMAQHPVPAPQPVNLNMGQNMNENNHAFQNGVAQHPVPAPHPINSNAGQHMNQHNHGFQDRMSQHPVPAPQPVDLNMGQNMNESNHASQNGMAQHPVPAPHPVNLNAGQHMNENNHGFQGTVAHDPAPRVQPNGNSHAALPAHAGDPYTGQCANIEVGSNGATSQMDGRQVTAQYPALCPVPTVTQSNQQVNVNGPGLHPFQYHNLRPPPPWNVQNLGGVSAHPRPSYDIPNINGIPIDPAALLKRRPGKPKNGVRKSEQRGRPQGRKRSTGTTSNEPSARSQSNGNGGLAPIPPGVAPPIPGYGSESGGAPPVQPVSRPNGRPTIPTSAETRAGVHPVRLVPLENGDSVPHANGNRQNKETINLEALEGGDGDVPPGKVDFGEIPELTSGSTRIGVPPGVSAPSAKGTETVPNMNDNPGNALFDLLEYMPQLELFELDFESFSSEMSREEWNGGLPGDLGQIPLSTGSDPAQPNAGQLGTEDFDASMQMMGELGHEDAPAAPGQIPSSTGSNSVQPNGGQPSTLEAPAQIPSST
ncbi:hypothetical protein GX51_04082, partial [Blastomyces parvus]